MKRAKDTIKVQGLSHADQNELWLGNVSPGPARSLSHHQAELGGVHPNGAWARQQTLTL